MFRTGAKERKEILLSVDVKGPKAVPFLVGFLGGWDRAAVASI
jgi:hypothetical protein